MGKPVPALAAVDAEPLQPLLEVGSERTCPARLVVEDEHPDAPRLAVAHRREARPLLHPGGSLTERRDDRGQLAGRPVAEEGERDVQVLARDDSELAGQVRVLPRLERVERGLG